MKYLELAEIKPSVIGLGCAAYGKSVPEKESFRLLDTYIEQGGNLLDTANVYEDWLAGEIGSSEKNIGRWMKERHNRHRVLVGTKGGHPPLSDMSVSRITPKEITHDVEESLKRLQTDFIDIYYLHRDDTRVPVEEIIHIMSGFVTKGNIRYFGCSNWTTARLDAARKYAESSNTKGFLINQIGWSLAKPNMEAFESTLVFMDDKQKEYYKKNRFPVAAFSSQANGFFSDKYEEGVRLADGSLNSVMKQYYNETSFKRQKNAGHLARQKGKSMNQIAIAYLLNQDFPVIALTATTRVEHIKEGCDASGIVLSKDEKAILEI